MRVKEVSMSNLDCQARTSNKLPQLIFQRSHGLVKLFPDIPDIIGFYVKCKQHRKLVLKAT